MAQQGSLTKIEYWAFWTYSRYYEMGKLHLGGVKLHYVVARSSYIIQRHFMGRLRRGDAVAMSLVAISTPITSSFILFIEYETERLMVWLCSWQSIA